jgi:hypothetical protein
MSCGSTAARTVVPGLAFGFEIQLGGPSGSVAVVARARALVSGAAVGGAVGGGGGDAFFRHPTGNAQSSIGSTTIDWRTRRLGFTAFLRRVNY